MYQPGEVEYHQLFVIEALDSDGNGIPGKYPVEIKVLGKSKSSVKVEVRIEGGSSDSKTSGTDGTMTVPIRFLVASGDVSLKLRFTVDGVNVITDSIELKRDRVMSTDVPSFITIPTLSNSTVVIN